MGWDGRGKDVRVEVDGGNALRARKSKNIEEEKGRMQVRGGRERDI